MTPATNTLSRRHLLLKALPTLGAAALFSRCAAALLPDPAELTKEFARLEKESGGRLGVAVLDTGSGATTGYRQDERFPMCSTSKLLSVAAVLERADRHKEGLDRVVHFPSSDLVAYSPVTEKHAGGIGITVRELCAAAITVSDNTAANLLLASIGGPAGFTAFARSLGDDVTRLDRNEPTLNEATPGDPRDTTSPLAIATDLRKLALGNVLSPASKSQLIDWLVANTTGLKRLRAGLPGSWKVGDKTGSGSHATSNDVAIAWPPSRPPVIIACYLTTADPDGDIRGLTIEAVGKAVAAAWQS